MNNNYTNNNFYGEIEGNSCSDYYKRTIKMNRGNAKENGEIINEILGAEIINGKEFSDEFWTKVFLQRDEEEYIGGVKLILTKDDSLYSESNIAKTLELMGTIILSGEKKKENPEGYIRVFHSKEMFNKAIDEQNAIRHIAENSSEGKYAMENGLDDLLVLSNQMNYKLEKRFNNLDDKDLEKLDKEYGTKFPTVHDYYIGYLTMKGKLREMIEIKKERGYLTTEERSRYKIIKKNIRSLKEDFIDCIDKKVRPIVFKVPLPDSGYACWDEFDDLDKRHIRAMLEVIKGNEMQDDLSVIRRDLDNTIEECKFTKMQYEVLQLLKKDKTQEEIGEILNITNQMVNKHINAIVNRIYNKNLEKYTDYYYMNVCYGEYLKCSQCGEIKIVQNFDKNGKRGYMSMCKQCRKR